MPGGRSWKAQSQAHIRVCQPEKHVPPASPHLTPRPELAEIAAAAKGETSTLGLRAAAEPIQEDAADTNEPAKVGKISSVSVENGSTKDSKYQSSISVVSDFKEKVTFWHHVLISLSVTTPNTLLVVFCSAMGFGFELYNAVAATIWNYYGNAILLVLSGLVAIMYIFDWHHWQQRLQALSATVCVVLLIAGAYLKGQGYPWAVMVVIIFLIPVSLGVLRISACRRVSRTAFYFTISMNTLVNALASLAAWILWIIMDDYPWNERTREKLISRSSDVYDEVYKFPLMYSLHCGDDKDLSSYNSKDKVDIGTSCATAATLWFLVYSCPFVVFCCNAVLAIFCFLQGVVLGHTLTNMTRLQRTLKQFVLCLALLLGGAYASLNFGGASFQMGSTILAFFAAAVLALLLWALVEVGPQNVISAVKGSQLMSMLAKIWTSDWARASFVSVVNVLIPIYFGLNMLNMRVRKYRGVAESEDVLTPGARRVMEDLKKWNWVSIMNKVNILAEIYFLLQVGIAKLTYVFLSWLNDQLKVAGFGVTVVICLITGYTMFLLPPVPGIPVYVFTGIVVGEQGRHLESLGFGGGIVVALVMCFFLKEAACCGQYTIGYYMGKSLKIQQLIGVDKVPTRAIERILSARGLTVGKVCILVGGPDWPTSVTCGILRMNIPQMCIGTAPVIFVVGPCVLAGAFLGRVKAGEDSIWNMLANISIGVSVVLNMGSMFWAVYKVMKTVQDHGEELAKPRPEHEAVAELTRREKSYNDAYKAVTSWQALGCGRKFIIITASALNVLTQVIFTAASEVCFRTFNISSRISDPYDKDGLNGDASKIVYEPFGWIVLALWGLGFVLHIWFIRDMIRKARRRLKQSEKAMLEDAQH
mmetsp:Transcript_99105/g.181792  ORF Transcript_99105/g.181792 Transcript_99105/m.181792 type:complete len:872 (-) Transcript_99105:3-2618(-)